MTQTTRIVIALLVVVLLVAAIVGIDAVRRRGVSTPAAAGEPTLVPGGIPITLDGVLVGSFSPDDLEQLEQASFVDAEEGKTQEGWLLRDVLLLHVDAGALDPDAQITVISSSRDKSVDLTWAEVEDESNKVMFDLSGRGTLKLVSKLERLDTRDEWVQDIDDIEIATDK